MQADGTPIPIALCTPCESTPDSSGVCCTSMQNRVNEKDEMKAVNPIQDPATPRVEICVLQA
jgi:hypothetical protein